jgi:sterol desaturase/sphingolipid hydroxylase (fatty acid hydroxylase superfamily)
MADTEGWAEVQRLATLVVWQTATNLGSRLSPLNLLAMLMLCLVLWRLRRPAVSFLAWVFPARVYRSPSFWLDVKLYLVGFALSLVVAVNGTAVTTLAATAFGAVWGAKAPLLTGTGSTLAAALIVFLASDGLNYWYHRINHTWRWLWPIHALHHSAEELNPVTAYRHHPLYHILGAPLNAAVTGVTQAVLLVFITGSLDLYLLAGTNLFYAVFNISVSNLRHSHIWLRYPRAVEHILISPAQHQCHHSVDPRHHNRNYGEVLALWDWMFGTLYLPERDEVIRFGLGDATGQPLPQPHPTLARALLVPLLDAGRALGNRPKHERD